MNLSTREKIGFGLGDTASNLVWASLMSFIMFFYTDVFGIAAAAVGTMFLFARVFDGVTDFLIGAIADRTRTRWGKFRPYLLWMAIPLAVMMVLTFTVPGFSENGKVIYAWITYNLLMLAYTAVNIPYSALSGVMTDDPLERTSLNSYRMVLAQAGGFIVNAAMLPLVQALGRGNTALGYQLTAAVFGLAAVALLWFTFSSTRERIQPPPGQKTSLRGDLATLFRNPHWVILFAVGLLDLTFIIIRAGSLLYHCKYTLLLDDRQTSLFLVLGNVGFIAGALVTRFVVARQGKKGALILAHVIMAGSALAAFWLKPGNPSAALTLQVDIALFRNPRGGRAGEIVERRALVAHEVAPAHQFAGVGGDAAHDGDQR
jgi:glycoside/pentoside/hexuronide:cation symporter, GPH family